MKDGFIKAAASTPKIRVADVQFNSGNIIKDIKKAAEQGVKLIVFPELSITGYTCGDLFGQRLLIESAHEQLDRIKEETKDLEIISVVGLPLVKSGKLINAAAVLYK
ncbi:MAG: NAD(+) synthase, partial [Ruminiclostridium sp.]|nr:NAD(+) synthase [Ruminiclostridium sp.]